MDISTFERNNFAVLGHPGPGGTLQSVEVVPPTIAHGSLYSINVTGAGTKTDYNDGNYTITGRRHMHRRFSDLEAATTATPAANTQAGWMEHLQGPFPIIVGTVFNDEATASGMTVKLSGGPTQSGIYLERKITTEIQAAYPSNSRLRNICLDSQESPNSVAKTYSSFYLLTNEGDYAGKVFRSFMKTPIVEGGSTDFWAAFDTDDKIKWHAEPAEPQFNASDQTFTLGPQWIRIEILIDYVNDLYALLVNGQTITMTSRGKNGLVSGFIGAGSEFSYSQLGNTIQTLSDGGVSGVPVGWAMPVADYDWRRIELADSNDWETKTSSVPQPVIGWTDDDIEFSVNQGHFADLSNKHIFYVDGLTASYVGALV